MKTNQEENVIEVQFDDDQADELAGMIQARFRDVIFEMSDEEFAELAAERNSYRAEHQAELNYWKAQENED